MITLLSHIETYFHIVIKRVFELTCKICKREDQRNFRVFTFQGFMCKALKYKL